MVEVTRIKLKQQSLWNKEQERWAKHPKQQFIENSSSNKEKDSGEKEMTWKDILKAHCGTEKMGCKGCPKCEEKMEKKLVGNQKKIDADKDGKITGKDFAMLREKSGENFEKFFRRKEQKPDIQSDGIKFKSR